MLRFAIALIRFLNCTGLRFSGKNMSPRPAWLGGAQHAALNFSDVDLAVSLHFALFKGSKGYVLKPPEMVAGMDHEGIGAGLGGASATGTGADRLSAVHRSSSSSLRESSGLSQRNDDLREGMSIAAEDVVLFWPPPREWLHCVTLRAVSLHNLPKRGERRPRLGQRGGTHRGSCHKYVPELSGAPAPPTNSEPSRPGLKLALHPIGGFCAIGTTLPLPEAIETEVDVVSNARLDGLNAPFDVPVHCLAAEPHATFLKVSVTDGDAQEAVAQEAVVLGRLRGGYRVLQLRSLLGTRIELCYLFVCISRSSREPNLWLSRRQVCLGGSFCSPSHPVLAHSLPTKQLPESVLRVPTLRACAAPFSSQDGATLHAHSPQGYGLLASQRRKLRVAVPLG